MISIDIRPLALAGTRAGAGVSASSPRAAPTAF
jgi:hypothetical protein